jgi:hypothetical protein
MNNTCPACPARVHAGSVLPKKISFDRGSRGFHGWGKMHDQIHIRAIHVLREISGPFLDKFENKSAVQAPE